MPATSDTRALVLSGVLTRPLLPLGLVVGVWTGSVSVTSDAFHTFSAVGGVLMALVATRFGQRAANRFQTFGLRTRRNRRCALQRPVPSGDGRPRPVDGVDALRMPMELATGPMLWTAAGGIVTELASFWLLYRRQKEDLNIRGAFWQIVQTFVGSLILVVSALVIRFTGFLVIDSLLGMLFGLVLF